MLLQNTVVLVTGAGRGIGKAICEALLAENAKVCATDIVFEDSSVHDLAKTYGKDKVIFHKLDVRDETQFEDVIIKTKQYFGHLDVICNNAGIVDEANPKMTMEVNQFGTLNGIIMAHKHLVDSKGEKGGTVINTASTLGLTPSFLVPAYSASKSAIVGLTLTWGHAMNVKLTNVKVNAVCPDYTDTNMLSAHSNSPHEEIKKTVTEKNKKFWMKPSEIGNGVVKILQDGVSGKLLIVSGIDGTYYHSAQMKDYFA